MFRRFLEFIKNAASRIWGWIKKVVVKIVSFVKNIVNRFKELIAKGKLDPNKNEIPVALKEEQISQVIKTQLEKGDYATADVGLTGGIYTVVYDQETESIKEDTLEIIGYENLDSDTINAFKNEDMLVLK